MARLAVLSAHIPMMRVVSHNEVDLRHLQLVSLSPQSQLSWAGQAIHYSLGTDIVGRTPGKGIPELVPVAALSALSAGSMAAIGSCRSSCSLDCLQIRDVQTHSEASHEGLLLHSLELTQGRYAGMSAHRLHTGSIGLEAQS